MLRRWFVVLHCEGFPSHRRGILITALSLLALAGASRAQAQDQIGGIVVDANTNRPLPGAQVVIQGTDRGGLTQSDGRFLLLNIQQPRVTLDVIMLGYRTWSQPVAAGTTDLEVRLEQRAVELDALVVTGTPGAQQLRSVGNAVATVRVGQLAEISPPVNMESLLGGAVPGMSVSIGGGEIGGGANIRIRGASSISLSSQPLIYVDGVRVNGGSAAGGGVGVDGGVPPSRLNDINPANIASIEVIKGPAAATLYGTEASNGVINIITKKGTRGAPTFTLRLEQGINGLPDSAEEYFPETYYRCQGTSGDCEQGDVVAFNVLREDRIRHGYDWFQTGLVQGIGGSVSGGSESLRYFFSADWDRDEGIVSYNWKNQLNGRANLNWTPHEDLDVQFGISSVRSKLESASANQPITTAILWACPAPGCEEGSGLPNAVDGAYRGYIGYLPEVLEDAVEGFQEVHRTTYNLTINHRPVDWLSQRLVLGADWTGTDNSQLYRPIVGPGHFNPDGAKSVGREMTQYLTTDYSATATLQLVPGLRFATSGGVQFYQKQTDWVSAQGEIFPVPVLETISSGAQKDADEGFTENKTLGAYIQEQVSWRDRIFLTGAVRGDDNSAFGRNFDFVVYPKLSASWVVSEETFLDRLDWVGQLKLRTAWGRAGQQPDVFAALRTFEPVVGFGGGSGLTPQNIGNPDLEPEVGEEWEAGFDASLFQDRVGIQFTYYTQKTTDAIVAVPVRPSRGFPGIQYRNIGEVQNAGIELGVFGSLYQGSDVAVDLNLSLSTNQNELASLGGLAPQILQGDNPTTGWAHQYYAEGFPLGSIFLKRVLSADIEGTGEAAHAVNVMCEGGDVIPGTPNLSRGGGPAVPCADAPHLFRGAPVPTRQISAGATVTLFDDLQLYAEVDYQGGHTMIDGNAAGAHLFFRNTRAILERTDPILLGYETLGQDGINQAGLIDASFAKLRRLSASYTFPRALGARFGADRLSLTLSSHNLWTIWQGTDQIFGYPNLDPEMRNTSGTDSDPGGLSAYTQESWVPLRRFLATLSVTF